ncbi:MCPT3 protease, partial [Polypterus senegalus]
MSKDGRPEQGTASPELECNRVRSTCSSIISKIVSSISESKRATNIVMSITVVLGAHDMSKRETSWQLIQAEKMIPHPDFNSNSLLARKAKLKKKVKLVGIPEADDDVQHGDLCSVAGWGNTVTDGNGSNMLREVNVTIIYWDTCKKSWDAMIPEKTICAGGYKTTKGFCQGDSGGPLICNNKAMGIVSFNSIRGCEYPNLPNVYTSVAAYRDWINSVLQQHSHTPL